LTAATAPAVDGRTDAPPPHHALVVALLANAVAAAVKLAAFAVTGASVLLSEGVHSVADCGNQGALLLGHRSSSSPPSARHPLGLGRARYLWAFLVAVVVFGGSAVVAFAEATYRLLNPADHPEHAAVTLAALGVAVAIESVSIVSAVRDARPVKGDAGWVEFIRASRDPDLPVLVVEDLADLVGLVLALVATVLVELTGAAVLDVVASYLIGLVLAANAVFLAWEMASLVLGEAALPEVERAVLAAVGTGGSGWRAASVQVVHLGPTELLVVVKVGGCGSGGDRGGGGAGRDGDELSGWLVWAGAQAAAAAAPLAARVLFEVDDGEPWTP
jgi:cation diffusion facilitator family transporter